MSDKKRFGTPIARDVGHQIDDDFIKVPWTVSEETKQELKGGLYMPEYAQDQRITELENRVSELEKLLFVPEDTS